MRTFVSRGDGSETKLWRTWEGVCLEEGVRIFHPETFEFGTNVYVGHDTILHGYPKSKFRIGSDVWIGPQCYLHAAGGITIGNEVGIGPGVHLLTSTHYLSGRDSILGNPLRFLSIEIEDGVDIGMGSEILPGVRIARGCQIGAGSVVTRSVPAFSIVVGNPARVIGIRE